MSRFDPALFPFRSNLNGKGNVNGTGFQPESAIRAGFVPGVFTPTAR